MWGLKAQKFVFALPEENYISQVSGKLNFTLPLVD
jgi:hypothetical protein